MDELMMHNALNTLTQLIDAIGVITIIIGIIYSLTRFFKSIALKKHTFTIDALRLELGRSIVLAVEFLLAADIIRTMVAPDYYSLGLLGGLVVIRTVLTYFLDLELKGIKR